MPYTKQNINNMSLTRNYETRSQIQYNKPKLEAVKALTQRSQRHRQSSSSSDTQHCRRQRMPTPAHKSTNKIPQ